MKPTPLNDIVSQNRYITFDSAKILSTWFEQGDLTTCFYVQYEVIHNDIKYKYESRTEFPRMIVSDKIWKLWNTCINLNLLNLYPFTKFIEYDESDEFISEVLYHMNQVYQREFSDSAFINVDRPDINILKPSYFVSPNSTFVVPMSGGKESLLTFELLRQYATNPKNVNGIFVQYNGIMDRSEGVNAYEYLKDLEFQVSLIRSDIVDILSLVHPDWGRFGRYLSVTMLLIAMYAESRGIQNIVMGNEYDNTCPDSNYYGNNYDQSTLFEATLTNFLIQNGIYINVFSVLSNLSETAIQLMLWKTDSCIPYIGIQNSCSMGRVPCHKCDKCKRIAAIRQAIGLNTHNFDPTIFTTSPEKIFNTLNGRKEAETLVYLLNEQGFNIQSDIKPVYHPEVFEYVEDEHHPSVTMELKEFIIGKLDNAKRKGGISTGSQRCG